MIDIELVKSYKQVAANGGFSFYNKVKRKDTDKCLPVQT